ncbi:cysteine hydrolase family protein [Methanopyrus sp.]
MYALLIIDMIRDFVEEGAPLEVPKARQLVPRIARLADEFRERGGLVVHVWDEHYPDDPEFKVWGEHAVAGTEGAEPVEELKPKDGDLVVRKRKYSGFYGTSLDYDLRSRNVKEIYLTGVCTDICVLFTCADALMRGYRVYVVRDCVASLEEESHRFALNHMEKLGAEVIDSEEMLGD